MRMFKTLAAAAALVGLATAAHADGMYTKPSYKDVPAISVPTWAGFYVGVNAGAIINRDDRKHDVTEDVYKYNWKSKKYDYYGSKDVSDYYKVSDDSDITAVAGLHIGYNAQRGDIVYGIEADLGLASDVNYIATIRGRLGVASGNLLFYVTGGLAAIGYDSSYSINSDHGSSWSFEDTETDTGWVAGVGFEKKIARNISFGIEGLYYNFDEDKKSHYLGSVSCCLELYSYKYYADTEKELDFWTVRARLTFHAGQDYEPLK